MKLINVTPTTVQKIASIVHAVVKRYENPGKGVKIMEIKKAKNFARMCLREVQLLEQVEKLDFPEDFFLDHSGWEAHRGIQSKKAQEASLSFQRTWKNHDTDGWRLEASPADHMYQLYSIYGNRYLWVMEGYIVKGYRRDEIAIPFIFPISTVIENGNYIGETSDEGF